jgi:hypothetical protein
VRRPVLFAAATLLAGASCASAPAKSESIPSASRDEVRQVAEAYLKAIAGSGDDSGRELLLGGATLTAKLFTLENWRIVHEEEPRHEEGDVQLAARLVQELDEASRASLSQVLGDDSETAAGVVTQITPEVAAKLMEPAQASANRLASALPVLAYVLRVGKGVYWSPKNPARALLAHAGRGGYVLDFHLFEIETKEGPRQVPRLWPLRVLRFKTASLDSGWKVLPASDWNAE